MTFKLVNKDTQKNEITFTMSFTAEEFDASAKKAYNENKGKFTIPGFRKGKAPQTLIERYYGEGVFYEDAIDGLLQENYGKALDELNIDPIGQLTNMSLGDEPVGKGKGFTATITVPVAPVVEVKDYKGVEAVKILHTVTDKDVEAELAAAQKRNGRLVTVEDAAENGSTVILNYAGFVGEEQFEGGTAENQELVLGSGKFIPGFEEQLAGVKAGEDKDVTVTFPEEYHAEELAGKEAVFHCHINEVKKEELPEINDDFAAEVSEFDTLEEYRADIRKKLEDTAEEASVYSAKDAVMTTIYEANCNFDVPQQMIDSQADDMMQEFQQQLQYSGMDLASYCKILNKPADEIRDEFMPDAEKRVKSRLITLAIAEQEKIEASPEDIEEEISRMADMYKLEVAKIKELLGADSNKMLKQDIVMRKAVDFVYENAKITEKAEEAEEAAEAEAPEEKPAEE